MPKDSKASGSYDQVTLSVAIVDPDNARRKEALSALSGRTDLQITEFPSFPPQLNDIPQTLREADVVMLGVNSDPDRAYDLAEALCAKSRTYLMAYSSQVDMKLAIRFMRAGAREFLTVPFDPDEVNTAIERSSSHLATPQKGDKASGKLYVFLGTKGGCGVTTLASNFALALAQESDCETLLIDLGLPLGDVAINLGMKTNYSVTNALQQSGRLDANFLSSLVAKHESGLSVLPAAGEFPDKPATASAVDALLSVARQKFDFVVVDTGSRVDLMDSTLFDHSATIFLIAQVGISELLTGNRMIRKFFSDRGDRLQIVLNRYKPSDSIFDEKTVTEALTRAAQWKIPDDYAAARRTRETATPMVLGDSAIAHALRQMARTNAGISPSKDGKKGFLRFLR